MVFFKVSRICYVKKISITHSNLAAKSYLKYANKLISFTGHNCNAHAEQQYYIIKLYAINTQCFILYTLCTHYYMIIHVVYAVLRHYTHCSHITMSLYALCTHYYVIIHVVHTVLLIVHVVHTLRRHYIGVLLHYTRISHSNTSLYTLYTQYCVIIQEYLLA